MSLAQSPALPLSLLLSLCACSPEVVAPTPRYPSTAQPAAEQRTLTFTPASDITRLTLPCSAHELEKDNGLDDDCDGHIDRQVKPSEASLFIALSHNTQVDVELSVTATGDSAAEASLEKSVISRVQVCEAAEPFAMQEAAFTKLERGRYELAIVHGKACGATLPATVDASLWLEGKTQGVYGVTVAPEGRSVLGTLEVR